jgi:uncharacterized protein YdaU (DUF1376 family)
MGEVISINTTPGDFVQDTQHLTTAEVGAYTLICHQIVIIGQKADPPSLPDDDVMMANITRQSVREWRKMKPRLCSGDMAVLTLAQGRISQLRVAYEISEARDRIERSYHAGVKSGESRRKKAEIRERLLNGPSNGGSTDVRTVVEHPFDASSLQPSNPMSNPTRTSHESLVTSYEEPTGTTSLPSPIGDVKIKRAREAKQSAGQAVEAFTLEDSHRIWAAQNCPSVPVDVELEAWRVPDEAGADPRPGRVMANVDAQRRAVGHLRETGERQWQRTRQDRRTTR